MEGTMNKRKWTKEHRRKLGEAARERWRRKTSPELREWARQVVARNKKAGRV